MENSLSYKTSSTMKCIMLIILIIMAEHGFEQSDKKLSQETNFYSNHFIRNKTYNKIRLAKSRTLYYASTIMILRLILSVDIPGNKQTKSPTCSTCNETVRSNSKKVYCTVCRSITHLKYITSNKKFIYNNARLDLFGVFFSKCFTFL